jgi:hypothetical protein
MEALGCGAEIIISDISVFREIYRNSAHYIELKSKPQSVDLKGMLSHKCNGADEVLAYYTWENQALRLLKVMEEWQ